MISEDLANMADRMAGYVLHKTGPSPNECGAIAAELLKLSGIVKTMEELPLDRTLLQLLDPVPEWQFVRMSSRDDNAVTDSQRSDPRTTL